MFMLVSWFGLTLPLLNAAVLYVLRHEVQSRVIAGFSASFLLLSTVTDIYIGSTFQIIPAASRSHRLQGAAGGVEHKRERAPPTARLETAAALGFISAIG